MREIGRSEYLICMIEAYLDNRELMIGKGKISMIDGFPKGPVSVKY